MHVFNYHRGSGGSDNAWTATIASLRDAGLEIGTFSRDSREIPEGLAGRASAFFSGIYARNSIADFARSVAEFEPDVVHAHELYPLITPWIIRLCYQRGIPVVYTCYDYRLTCPIATHFRNGSLCLECRDHGMQHALSRNCRGHVAESAAYAARALVADYFGLVTRYVTQFVVLTDFSRQWLAEAFGIPDSRISTVPCAIELPDKAADPAVGEYVGFAGRFAREKGVEILLEAARTSGLPVKLAGNEPTHPAILPTDTAECVMTPDRRALADFYRRARMLVVPSIWYETFGIVAAESMSHGIPVIASRIGALQYTVNDGVNGLLFETRNSADLAVQMRRLWNDVTLVRRLGAAARETVASSYSPSAHVDGTIAAYERALAIGREHRATT